MALCRNLEVSKAGYYAWRERKPSVRTQTDEALREQIHSIHHKSGGSYGSPTIQAELKADGTAIGRKRVARLMREEQLRSKKRRPRRATTQSSHDYPVASNLLDRQFLQLSPDLAWAADITYFQTGEGWLYLAVVLDLFSRRIVGWSMSRWIDAALVIGALRMAVERRQPKRGLIVHTDRGSQYACNDYQAFIARHGIVASMSRKRDCWDNAVVESFFASLKSEVKPDRLWSTRNEAKTAIFEYIEAWYNPKRRHSTLGYQSPMEFEERRCVA